MKTLNQWLSLYSESHQNKINRRLHKMCVPLIFFSVQGLIWSIPGYGTLIYLLAVLLCMIFYIRLGWKAAGAMAPQFLLSYLILAFWTLSGRPIFVPCLAIFIVAWVGQFWGHHIEGKKPSFFQDLQFLLIGPLWVLPFKI